MNNKHDALNHNQRRARRPASQQALKRAHPVLGGVAGGIAQFVGAKPIIVRLLFVLALILTFGMFGLVYIILWKLLPA